MCVSVCECVCVCVYVCECECVCVILYHASFITNPKLTYTCTCTGKLIPVPAQDTYKNADLQPARYLASRTQLIPSTEETTLLLYQAHHVLEPSKKAEPQIHCMHYLESTRKVGLLFTISFSIA